MERVTSDDVSGTRIRDLRAIRTTHRGFLFREMYAAGFPIRRMERIERDDGSVDASRTADNIWAFNLPACQRCPGTLLGALPLRATDVDTIEKPATGRAGRTTSTSRSRSG